MALDDPLDRRQPDAEAGELGISMKTLERLEELIGEFHGETRPVVTQEIYHLSYFRLQIADCNPIGVPWPVLTTWS